MIQYRQSMVWVVTSIAAYIHAQSSINAEFVVSSLSGALTVSVRGADWVEGADLGSEV